MNFRLFEPLVRVAEPGNLRSFDGEALKIDVASLTD